MKKIGSVLIVLMLLGLCACGQVNYRDKVVTEKNFTTIFKEENDLTEEENELIVLATTQYMFDPSGMYNKKISDIIEEGRILKRSKEEANKKPENMLKTIKNEFVTKLWNDVFCDISWYVAEGTNSVGEEMDIEYTLNKASRLMEKRDEYNNYIENLDDEKYSQVKYIWGKLLAEIDRMYDRIKNETPRAKDSTYEFNTGSFDTYSEDFGDEIKNIK